MACSSFSCFSRRPAEIADISAFADLSYAGADFEKRDGGF